MLANIVGFIYHLLHDLATAFKTALIGNTSGVVIVTFGRCFQSPVYQNIVTVNEVPVEIEADKISVLLAINKNRYAERFQSVYRSQQREYVGQNIVFCPDW